MKKNILTLLVALVFLGIELFFVKQGVYTFNWVSNGMFFLTSIISFAVFFILYLFKNYNAAIITLSLGFLIIVPVNMYYLTELNALKSSSDKIVHWAYQEKLRTNFFPDKLTIEHDERIHYTKSRKNSFSLTFSVSSPSSGHFYNSSSGWGYSDD